METRLLDASALRFNQAAIMAIVIAGFILDQILLPAFVAAVLLAGSFRPGLALFKQTYLHLLKPAGIMKPDLVDDSPEPHQFAQLLGGVFLGAGCLLLAAGSPLLGWSLSWLVVLLAAVNFFFGFCAGCFLYYQLARLGIPGFRPRLERGNVR